MAVTDFGTANQTYRVLMGNGLIYTVPRFQRDYTWTDVDWNDLTMGCFSSIWYRWRCRRSEA
jgi:hypothetical protein